MKKFLLILLVMSVGFQGTLLAQTRTVTGTVTGGDDGLGIPRVNVTVKGTTRGVATDFDGKYSIEAGNSETLVFSFIGYVSQEVVVGNQTTVDIVLQPDYAQLGEVVVVGYGSQEKKEITSAVVSLDEEQFNKGNVNDPTQLLQGKVAGLSIYNKGGDPNASPIIRLRGISTVGSNAQPLIVIDGVIGADLANVDPNDIESMNVLKDGSAAAIYGSRGSAGVIIVTTKSGSRDKGLQADYNGQLAAADVFRYQPVMSASQFVEAGGNDLGHATDWQKEITQTGVTQVHNLAVSGGNANTTFRMSANFRDVQGVLKKSGFEQINTRANVNHYALNDKLNLQFNFAMTNRDQNFSWNEAFRYASLYNPTAPIFFEGSTNYYQAILFDNYNPVGIIEQNQNVGNRSNTNFNVQGSYEIVDGLRVTMNYARQNSQFTGGTWSPRSSLFRGYDRGGLATRRTDQSRFELFEAYGAWDKDFSDNVKMTLTAGYSYQSEQFEGFGVEAGDFPTEDIGFNILGASGDILQSRANASFFSYQSPNNKIIAFFGRFNLTIGEGIFVNGSLRREGSTKLGADNQWGLFPALGAGVDILAYASIPSMSQFKVRAGYGVTGSLPGPSGLSQDLFNYSRDQGGNVSFVRAGNPDLKWEEKSEINLGIDFGFMDNKLSGTLDLYTRDINDFVLERTVDPAIYGTNLRYENAGKLNTKGLEVALNYNSFEFGEVTWSPGIVLSSYKTILEDFVIPEGMRANLGSPGQNGTNMIRTAVGEEIGQIWGAVYVGPDENGNPIYQDLNGDGVINTNPGNALAEDGDFTQLGSGIPDLEFGWTNVVSFRNWDLNAFFRGAFGHSLVNTYRAFYEARDGSINSFNRTITDLYDANLKSSQYSSLHVEKADFFKLDNVTLGYNFNMANSTAFRNIRAYFSVQNAFVITNYQGIDPEPALSDGGDVLAPGIDRRNNYFANRTFTLGVNIGF